jgi:predicted nucleotidyltransferase
MDNSSIHNSVSLPVPVPNEDIFRYSACGPILSLLTDTPHSSFGIRDLGRAIDRPHRSISLAVEDLESVGLVTTTTEGGQKLVQINRNRLTRPDDPILRVPQEAFRDPVRSLQEKIFEDLETVTGILLFGSVARGNADRRSDIDCFVLVGTNRATNQKRAHELAQELGSQRFDGDRYAFEILVESTKSVERQANRLQEIFADGLTLYDTGSLSELKTEVLTNGQ